MPIAGRRIPKGASVHGGSLYRDLSQHGRPLVGSVGASHAHSPGELWRVMRAAASFRTMGEQITCSALVRAAMSSCLPRILLHITVGLKSHQRHWDEDILCLHYRKAT